MILNDTQIKRIADLGRTLPDTVLAPLVLEMVLGRVLQPVEATPQAAPHVTPSRKERAATVAKFVAAHPGVAMAAIQAKLACPRSTAQFAVTDAIAAELIHRRGEKRGVQYFPGKAPVDPAPELKPAVLLTEQRFEGANHQRLVKVERRRGVGTRKAMPPEAERRETVVDYIRLHPGAQMGEIAEHMGCSRETARRAVQMARSQGRVRMEGTLGRAKYFVRTIVNGAASAVTT